MVHFNALLFHNTILQIANYVCPRRDQQGLGFWGRLPRSQALWACQGSPFCDGTCQYRRHKRPRFDPCVRKIPWNREWQPNRNTTYLSGLLSGLNSIIYVKFLTYSSIHKIGAQWVVAMVRKTERPILLLKTFQVSGMIHHGGPRPLFPLFWKPKVRY